MQKKELGFKPVFMFICLALGVAWGVLFDSFVFWMLFGLMFGLVIDFGVYYKKRSNKEQ